MARCSTSPADILSAVLATKKLLTRSPIEAGRGNPSAAWLPALSVHTSVVEGDHAGGLPFRCLSALRCVGAHWPSSLRRGAGKAAPPSPCVHVHCVFCFIVVLVLLSVCRLAGPCSRPLFYAFLFAGFFLSIDAVCVLWPPLVPVERAVLVSGGAAVFSKARLPREYGRWFGDLSRRDCCFPASDCW